MTFASAPSPSGATHRETLVRAASHALCGVVPIVFTLYMIWYSIAHHAFAFDFDRAFWPAGVSVLHGLSPYPSPTSFAATHGIAFVYPAPGALFFVLFSWLPHGLANALFTALCLASVVGTLWLLGVRDWRVYGVAFLWGPVLSGWQTANLSLVLALALALAWRYRDRAVVAGLILGIVISLKLFLWPVAAWLLLTRRWRAFGVAVATGFATTLVAWAVLGFDRLHSYIRLVNAVTKLEEVTAYTPLALVLRLGLDHAAALAVSVLLAVLVSVATIRAAREARDSTVLLGSIVVSLLLTPIVWRHYFVLLLVPLAICRPRLSAAWVIPVVLVIVPVTSPAMWQLCLTLAAIAALVLTLFARPSRDPSWTDARPNSGGGQRSPLWRPGRASPRELSA